MKSMNAAEIFARMDKRKAQIDRHNAIAERFDTALDNYIMAPDAIKETEEDAAHLYAEQWNLAESNQFVNMYRGYRLALIESELSADRAQEKN